MKDCQNPANSTPIRTLLVAVIALLFCQTTKAGLSDFGDTTLWTPQTFGYGTSIQNVPDGFQVSFAADSHGADFYGQYVSTFALHGDFTIDIDYALTTWPVGNGVRLGITVLDWFGTVVRGSQTYVSSPFGDEVYTFVAEGRILNVLQTTDMAGKLRLTRSGSSLGGYFWNGADWTVIGLGQVVTSDVNLRFEAWSHDAFFNGEAVVVTFTNPQISPDAFIPNAPIPEPSTYLAGALLLLPFGFSAVRHFRGRRQAA